MANAIWQVRNTVVVQGTCLAAPSYWNKPLICGVKVDRKELDVGSIEIGGGS